MPPPVPIPFPPPGPHEGVARTFGPRDLDGAHSEGAIGAGWCWAGPGHAQGREVVEELGGGHLRQSRAGSPKTRRHHPTNGSVVSPSSPRKPALMAVP